MYDETPDPMTDDDGAYGRMATFSNFDAAGADDTDEYLLNDIGVAMRLLSERA